MNPRLANGGGPPDGPGRQWFHIRQNKHHRWSLDESQIYQYHLGGALHPRVLWWEAMEVPRRSVQFLTLGEEVTVVSLVCEDLAEKTKSPRSSGTSARRASPPSCWTDRS